MAKALVYYKFKSEKDYQSMEIKGKGIRLEAFEYQIMKQKDMLKYAEDFKLTFYDAETNKLLYHPAHFISKNQHVIVVRCPKTTEIILPIEEDENPGDKVKDLLTESIKRKEDLEALMNSPPKAPKIIRPKFGLRAGDEKHLCKVCKKLMVDPTQVKCCQYTFCLACLESEESKNGKCPHCDSEQMRPFIANKFMQLRCKRLRESGKYDHWL
ncbi:hypothetical protein ACOME3_003109 [Neoechinorhynchus agilis]